MELKELSWANAKVELGVAFTFLTKWRFIDKKSAKTFVDSKFIRIFALSFGEMDDDIEESD